MTPEIVRVIFLLSSGRSRFFSFGFRHCISSALDKIWFSLYLPATLILSMLTSSLVGFGILIKYSMISLQAFWVIIFHLAVNCLFFGYSRFEKFNQLIKFFGLYDNV